MTPSEKKNHFATVIGALASGQARVRIMDGDGAVVFDATDFILDLVRVNKGWQEDGNELTSLFLTDAAEQVRVIGEKLDAAHGFEGLVSVLEVMSSIYDNNVSRELEMAWAGIGGLGA